MENRQQSDIRPQVIAVDGDEFFLQILKTRLAREGLGAYPTGDGGEALALMHLHPASVVVLAFSVSFPLSGKDGYEVLAEKALDPKLRGIPVIALADEHPDIDVERMNALGASRVILKQRVSLQDIVTAVQEELDECRRMSEEARKFERSEAQMLLLAAAFALSGMIAVGLAASGMFSS